jgi:uncharacterized membrane protein YoaK (UPF0700 family)
VLVPPYHYRFKEWFRRHVLGLTVGVLLGVLIGVLGWVFTAEALWFLAVPIFASLLCAIADDDIPVLWMSNRLNAHGAKKNPEVK